MAVLESVNRARAGTNEKRFQEFMRKLGVNLEGKQCFKQGNVQISVDESFTHKDKQYLIEIDSGNMAKLLVGQYVLLNQLHPQSRRAPVFLVIHNYKGYNPKRTINNLHLINQQLYAGNGLEFGAMHFDQLDGWDGNFDSLLAQVHRPH
jgi:hypothetical protein